jgi:hypothetical protein
MERSAVDISTLVFNSETTEVIRKMADLTHAPNEEELVRDALNTFRWLVQHQMEGYKIVAYKGDYDHPEDPHLLENLWEEKKAA